MDVLGLPAKLELMDKRLRDSVDPAVLAAALRRTPVELTNEQYGNPAGLTAEQLTAINSASKAGFFLDFAPPKPKSK